MQRRALRPSFVATFAVGAVATLSGCPNGSVSEVNYYNPPQVPPDGSTECPAEPPDAGDPCDLQPSIEMCNYSCSGTAYCQNGAWVLTGGGCNPPALFDAGSEAAASDGGADGAGQDGGHLGDATGDVGPDAESE